MYEGFQRYRGAEVLTSAVWTAPSKPAHDRLNATDCVTPTTSSAGGQENCGSSGHDSLSDARTLTPFAQDRIATNRQVETLGYVGHTPSTCTDTENCFRWASCAVSGGIAATSLAASSSQAASSVRITNRFDMASVKQRAAQPRPVPKPASTALYTLVRTSSADIITASASDRGTHWSRPKVGGVPCVSRSLRCTTTTTTQRGNTEACYAAHATGRWDCSRTTQRHYDGQLSTWRGESRGV